MWKISHPPFQCYKLLQPFIQASGQLKGNRGRSNYHWNIHTLIFRITLCLLCICNLFCNFNIISLLLNNIPPSSTTGMHRDSRVSIDSPHIFSLICLARPQIIEVKFLTDRQSQKSLTQYTGVNVFFLDEIC